MSISFAIIVSLIFLAVFAVFCVISYQESAPDFGFVGLVLTCFWGLFGLGIIGNYAVCDDYEPRYIEVNVASIANIPNKGFMIIDESGEARTFKLISSEPLRKAIKVIKRVPKNLYGSELSPIFDLDKTVEMIDK